MKKIIKVQSMMRAFLAKRNVAAKFKCLRQDSGKCCTRKSIKNNFDKPNFGFSRRIAAKEQNVQASHSEAAVTIQKGN